GPSGAGKSTLLRALAGLLHTADHGTQSGVVLVDGQTPQDPPGRGGLVLQDPRGPVRAETTGRDVAFGLEHPSMPRAEIWPRLRGALDQAGRGDPLAHPTSALSGGESQRLAPAGSLALDSRMLLLDEPTSMLDERAGATVREAIADVVATRGTTLVVVEQHIE